MIQKEKKYAKFRFSFVLLFVFASFAACFALYMTNEDDEYIQTAEYFNDKKENISEVNELYTTKSVVNPVPKSKPADLEYFDNIVVFTNAQMTGFSKFIPKDNICYGSIDMNYIKSFINDKSFKSAYVMLDADCVKSDDLTALSDAINLLRKEKSDLTIYIVSVLPITAEKEKDGISNSEIDSFNSDVLKFANDNSVNYIDINSYFVGNDGKMPRSKTEYDGATLTDEAYSEIADFLLSHIV